MNKLIQLSGIEQKIYRIYRLTPFFLKRLIIPTINKLRIRGINKLKTPINLVFYVTNRCNAYCRHCFYWKNLNKIEGELTLEQIKKIALSLKHPLELLAITGGEPFLRKDLVEICKIFYEINKTKRINIATNGLLKDKIIKDVREILKNKNLRLTIFFSVDGLAKTHDYIRNIEGAFDKAIETIKELTKIENRNLGIFVATTISKNNYKELGKLIEYVKKLKIVHKFNLLRDNSCVFNIDPKLLNDFNPKEKSQKLPSVKELRELYLKIRRNSKDLPSDIEALKIKYSIDMLDNKKEVVRCLAGKTDGVVFANGDVSVCEPIKAFANLKETNFNFHKLWNLEKAKININKCFCLQSCNLLNAMKYDTKTLLRLR